MANALDAVEMIGRHTRTHTGILGRDCNDFMAPPSAGLSSCISRTLRSRSVVEVASRPFAGPDLLKPQGSDVTCLTSDRTQVSHTTPSHSVGIAKHTGLRERTYQTRVVAIFSLTLTLLLKQKINVKKSSSCMFFHMSYEQSRDTFEHSRDTYPLDHAPSPFCILVLILRQTRSRLPPFCFTVSWLDSAPHAGFASVQRCCVAPDPLCGHCLVHTALARGVRWARPQDGTRLPSFFFCADSHSLATLRQHGGRASHGIWDTALRKRSHAREWHCRESVGSFGICCRLATRPKYWRRTTSTWG